MENEKPKVRLRGFSAMSPERIKEVAASGGRKAHQLGRGHQWNAQEAREAGRKGGSVKRIKTK